MRQFLENLRDHYEKGNEISALVPVRSPHVPGTFRSGLNRFDSVGIVEPGADDVLNGSMTWIAQVTTASLDSRMRY